MKCDECGADAPISVATLEESGVKSLCMDCLYGESVEAVDPPLGWQGYFHEGEVMREYARVQWKGVEQ